MYNNPTRTRIAGGLVFHLLTHLELAKAAIQTPRLRGV